MSQDKILSALGGAVVGFVLGKIKTKSSAPIIKVNPFTVRDGILILNFEINGKKVEGILNKIESGMGTVGGVNWNWLLIKIIPNPTYLISAYNDQGLEASAAAAVMPAGLITK